MRTPRSRASSPSKTAAIAATDKNTERHRPPKPRSPPVRDPQIPIVALAKRPLPPRGFLLGRLSCAGPGARPTVAKGPAPETLHRSTHSSGPATVAKGGIQPSGHRPERTWPLGERTVSQSDRNPVLRRTRRTSPTRRLVTIAAARFGRPELLAAQRNHARRRSNDRRAMTIFGLRRITSGDQSEGTGRNEHNGRRGRYESKGRTERRLPMRQRPKVQALLRGPGGGREISRRNGPGVPGGRKG
jgi:hypothetical protein